MFELADGVPAEIVPLSWLLGVWEGSGVLAYTVGEETIEREFRQRVAFTHDGMPWVAYAASVQLSGADGAADSDDGAADSGGVLAAETGYWRISRPLGAQDPGPGLLPGTGERPFRDAESVETLRNAGGGFDLEVSIVHPDGVSELYLGQVQGARIDLATDAVVRTATAKDYSAATRLYGLVDGHLLWAWDIAALGQDLRTHASGRLARVD